MNSELKWAFLSVYYIIFRCSFGLWLRGGWRNGLNPMSEWVPLVRRSKTNFAPPPPCSRGSEDDRGAIHFSKLAFLQSTESKSPIIFDLIRSLRSRFSGFSSFLPAIMARIRLRLFLAGSSRAPLLRKGAAALRFAGLLPAYACAYSFAGCDSTFSDSILESLFFPIECYVLRLPVLFLQ